MQQVLRGVAGLALMAALFWVVLRGHDPHAVAEALLRASIVGVAAGATLNFAHNIFRTWRWGALLAPAKPEVPFLPMFAAHRTHPVTAVYAGCAPGCAIGQRAHPHAPAASRYQQVRPPGGPGCIRGMRRTLRIGAGFRPVQGLDGRFPAGRQQFRGHHLGGGHPVAPTHEKQVREQQDQEEVFASANPESQA